MPYIYECIGNSAHINNISEYVDDNTTISIGLSANSCAS